MKVETVNAQTPIQAAASTQPLSNAYAWPDAQGRFGPYGGQFVAETLMPLIHELDAAYKAAKADPSFQAELDGYLGPLRRSREPAVFRRAPDRTFRRGQHLAEVRT